jgi:DNA polymerase III epsilon subunit-like protein
MARMTTNQPLLAIDLVPKSMWEKNVRAVVSKEFWEALRWSFGATQLRPLFAQLGELPYPERTTRIRCNTCGSCEDSYELHEVWQYDDLNLVQRLTKLIPICHKCHLVVHFGLANKRGLGETAKRHLAKVNGWSAREVDSHISSAFETWERRSRNEYSLDLSWLNQWLPSSKIHLNWLNDAKHARQSRYDVIAWSQQRLNSDAVIVDTETTGLLDFPKVEVIELAIISTRGRTLYHSRFRPRYRIPKRTIEIHGITNDTVKDAPKFKTEYDRIRECLDARTVITYKADFDRGVIERTCAEFNLEPPECQWECAMRSYSAFLETGRWQPLPNAKHGALQDCRAVLKLIRRMARGG